MTLKVSVIVPVFNEEKYLPGLLESLKNQTSSPKEIIFCDNNSSDNSLSIINSYKSILPIIIIKEKQKGILPTIERAWRETRGDLIIRTDADALLPKNYVKKCIKYYESRLNTQASTGPILSAEFHMLYSFLYPLGTVFFNTILSFVRGYPLILGPNTVVRRSALVRINGYLTDIKTIDDHLLTKKLHSHNLKIDYVLIQYNFHSIRRWLKNPINILKSIFINFNPSIYTEKN